MNVDSNTPRVWVPPMVPNHTQRPPLNHESQIQNQDQIQNLNLNQNFTQHHIQPEPGLVYPPQGQQQPQSFNMNRQQQQQYDVNTPLSYPPPQPPAATRSISNTSYGQAPQGTPYPPPTVTTPVSAPPRRRDGRASPKSEAFYAPNAAELYNHAQMMSGSPSPGPEGSGSSQGGAGRDHYPSSSVPRLPPILQVEKQQVTTSATQAASASRRRNEAHFVCPVPGCGSTFTRRFNLRGHLRSHTEERPYVCDWPGCKKGFARQHDCKRHQALHSTKSQSNICPGCKKTFSRLDALNRHLRSEGGSDCRQVAEAKAAAAISAGTGPSKKRKTEDEEWENQSDQGSSRI